jgi:ElaB/YqjD/DUF883 family membrane-anchored ribosome-binding protein
MPESVSSSGSTTSYLKGSIKIPKQKWDLLPENSEISYVRNDGKFVKKCFVKIIYEKNGEKYMLCSNKLNKYNNDKYYSEYRLKFSSISELYKKVSQDSVIEYKLIRAKLEKELDEMKTKIAELEERVKAEEESGKKIIKLIKYLHNIKNLEELKKI